MDWFAYLRVLCAGLVVFGAALLLLPSLSMAGFGLMVYGDPAFPAGFSGEAKQYIRLAHAVMGAVMVGWFLTLRWVLGAAEHGTPGAWRAAVSAFAAWFVLDTGYSLASGFWPNAVLNTAVAALFVPGLVATRTSSGHSRAPATP
jgi:hypothetical protein